MRRKITVDSVKRMKTPAPGKRTRLYDTSLPGFIATKHSSGVVTFSVEYGPRDRRRRYAIPGHLGEITVKDARGAAEDKRREVRKGGDPLEDRAQQRAIPTWREWVEEYLVGVKARKKRPMEDVWYLQGNAGGRSRNGEAEDSEAMKRWGARRVSKITTRDVETLMAWVREHAASDKGTGATSANRWLASVAACFSAAIRAGFVEVNPAARIPKYPENPPRSRVLSDEELQRLRKALIELDDEEGRVLFTVLLETGCRKSEACRMAWADLDLPNAVWVIPSPKAGRPQAVPLALSTVHALRSLHQRSEWVFPGRHRGRHREDVRTLWSNLCEAAKLEGVNVHDVRRTYGLKVARHAGLLVASKLLRHSDPRITSRVYVPLGVEDLRSATEAVSQPAKVLPMRRARGRK